MRVNAIWPIDVFVTIKNDGKNKHTCRQRNSECGIDSDTYQLMLLSSDVAFGHAHTHTKVLRTTEDSWDHQNILGNPYGTVLSNDYETGIL